MRRTVALAVALLTLVICASSQIDRAELLLHAGSEAMLRAEYDSAARAFDRLTSDENDDPSGPVMMAAVLLQRAEDNMVVADHAAIDSFLTIAEFRARALSLDDSAHRSMLTFVASGRGVMSRLSAMKGDVFRAVREALSAASLAEDILDADSSAVDAGLVLGNYYYWKSRKVEIISWLPFVGDSRWEGLRLLEACAVNGQYQRYAAMNSLAWALMDAGRYADAEHWLRMGLQSYPSNRSFLRNLAFMQEKTEEYGAALDTWSSILMSFAEPPGSNPGAMFEGYTRRASILLELGRRDEALAELESARTFRDRIGRSVDIPRWEATQEIFRAAERALRRDRERAERPHAVEGQ